MISIFNGSERRFGRGKRDDVYIKIEVGIKHHLKLFKGARLQVLMCIALHVDEDGWSWPGILTIAKLTGLDKGTVSKAITELCNLEIDGHKVLLAVQKRTEGNRFDSNHYLVFPSDEEVKQYGPIEAQQRAVRDMPCTEKPYTEKSYTEKPSAEFPSAENAYLTRTNINKNQYKQEPVITREHAADAATSGQEPPALAQQEELPVVIDFPAGLPFGEPEQEIEDDIPPLDLKSLKKEIAPAKLQKLDPAAEIAYQRYNAAFGRIPKGFTKAWLDQQVQEFGAKRVLSGVARAIELGKCEATAQLRYIFEGQTDEELAQFDEQGIRVVKGVKSNGSRNGDYGRRGGVSRVGGSGAGTQNQAGAVGGGESQVRPGGRSVAQLLARPTRSAG